MRKEPGQALKSDQSTVSLRRDKRFLKRLRYGVAGFLLLCGLFFVAASFSSRQACALGFTWPWEPLCLSPGCHPCNMQMPFSILWRLIWVEQGWENQFWPRRLEPGLKNITEQLTAVGLFHTFAVGTFFDAKHQLETQRLFQELAARAHKDYQPSTEMCRFGTIVGSMASVQRKGDRNGFIFGQRALNRQMMTSNGGAAPGPAQDIAGRLALFKERFCNPYDNDGALVAICPDEVRQPGPGGAPDEKGISANKDINYGQTLMQPYTLRIDLDDGRTRGSWGTMPVGEAIPENYEDIPMGNEWNTRVWDNEDEEPLWALASNLYGHHIFEHLPEEYLKKKGNQMKVLDMRAVVAKRSVAQNSFNALVAMKSHGSILDKWNQHVRYILRHLGMKRSDFGVSVLYPGLYAADNYTSDSNGIDIMGWAPSHYAIMEILTKRIYQDPAFYTNLYDKPANVDRVGATLEAISLMQNMDSFRSHLRSEMALSVALELNIDELQTKVQNRMNIMASQEGM